MLFLKSLLISFVIFITLLVVEPYAQSIYVYVLASGATVSWDASANATYYELRLVGIKPNGQEVIFPSSVVTSLQQNVVKPRSGDFKVEIRACNGTECSPWIHSKDPQYATVNGQPMGWIIRWKVPKPTNIIIGFWNKLIIYFDGGKTNG